MKQVDDLIKTLRHHNLAYSEQSDAAKVVEALASDLEAEHRARCWAQEDAQRMWSERFERMSEQLEYERRRYSSLLQHVSTLASMRMPPMSSGAIAAWPASP